MLRLVKGKYFFSNLEKLSPFEVPQHIFNVDTKPIFLWHVTPIFLKRSVPSRLLSRLDLFKALLNFNFSKILNFLIRYGRVQMSTSDRQFLLTSPGSIILKPCPKKLIFSSTAVTWAKENCRSRLWKKVVLHQLWAQHIYRLRNLSQNHQDLASGGL